MGYVANYSSELIDVEYKNRITSRHSSSSTSHLIQFKHLWIRNHSFPRAVICNTGPRDMNHHTCKISSGSDTGKWVRGKTFERLAKIINFRGRHLGFQDGRLISNSKKWPIIWRDQSDVRLDTKSMSIGQLEAEIWMKKYCLKSFNYYSSISHLTQYKHL